MKKFFAPLFLLIFVSLACTSSFFATPTPAPTPTPPPVGTRLDIALPTGNAARGELLFTGQVNGNYACSGCHGIFEGQISTCPSIIGLAERAAEVIPGYSAEKYIWEAIVSPDAYVVEGYTPGIMPQNFGERMSAQDLADILAFLMMK